MCGHRCGELLVTARHSYRRQVKGDGASYNAKARDEHSSAQDAAAKPCKALFWWRTVVVVVVVAVVVVFVIAHIPTVRRFGQAATLVRRALRS